MAIRTINTEMPSVQHWGHSYTSLLPMICDQWSAEGSQGFIFPQNIRIILKSYIQIAFTVLEIMQERQTVFSKSEPHIASYFHPKDSIMYHN